MPGAFVGNIELTDVGSIKIDGTNIQSVFVGGTQVFPPAGGILEPTSIGTGLQGWWKFSRGVTDVAGDVSNVADQSIGGAIGDLSQATAARRPPLITGGANGQPYADFDGSTFLASQIFTAIPVVESTLFGVFDIETAFATLTQCKALDGAATTVARMRTLSGSGGSYTATSDAGVSVTLPSATSDTIALVFRSKPASAGGDILDDQGNEDVDLAGAPPVQGQIDRFVMASNSHNSASSAWIGRIYELGMYDNAVSDSDRTALIDWMKSEYGL